MLGCRQIIFRPQKRNFETEVRVASASLVRLVAEEQGNGLASEDALVGSFSFASDDGSPMAADAALPSPLSPPSFLPVSNDACFENRARKSGVLCFEGELEARRLVSFMG